jgi:hypothetical protein
MMVTVAAWLDREAIGFDDVTFGIAKVNSGSHLSWSGKRWQIDSDLIRRFHFRIHCWK